MHDSLAFANTAWEPPSLTLQVLLTRKGGKSQLARQA
jgi:hypothetical protein